MMYERPFIVYLKLCFAVSYSQVGDFFYIANCVQIKIADIHLYICFIVYYFSLPGMENGGDRLVHGGIMLSSNVWRVSSTCD